MRFHDMTYMATPQHKNRYLGVMKLDPSLVIITLYLVNLSVPRSTEEDFQSNTLILRLTLTQNCLPFEWRSYLQFSVSLPYRCFLQNLIKIGPVVLEKILTHDRRRTQHDNGRQPIVIAHRSDSGDLKSSQEATTQVS